MPSAVSVLTLAKGRAEHLSRLIEGLDRSLAAPVELIVVDMGGARIPAGRHAYPIRVLDLHGDGLPLARARNAAAAAAESSCLLFLDVDCIPRASLVQMMAAQLATADQLVCVEVRYLDRDTEKAGWTEESLQDASIPHPARDFPANSTRIESNPGLFWSLAFGINHDTFDALGGFDESFQGYGAEDTDFGFRAAAAGIELCFMGGTGAFHQYHDSYSPPLQHFDDIVRNAMVFHRKWNWWPMEGWLVEFEKLCLIRRSSATIQILQRPDRDALLRARTGTAF
jgi:GT2 family glycosyltransferase